jgi:hypothetical protein
MAGEQIPKDKQESKEEPKKRKGLKFKPVLPASLKGMMDGLIIVLTPFVIFVVLFLYVMGLIPPQPVIIELTGEAAAGPDTVYIVEGAGAGQDFHGPPGPAAESGTGATAEGARVTALESEAAPIEIAEPETVYVEPATAGDEAAEVRAKRIKQLAKVYERMNASSVASIVGNMSSHEAVEILSQMNPRNAAKVLATLDPEKAAEFSLLLTLTEE